MPVLMAETNTTQPKPSSYEMDKLVEEVRERLCLKSREKLNSVRRSTPYSRKGSAFVDSPEHGESPHRFSQRARDVNSRRETCSRCSWRATKCKCTRSSDLTEAPSLLKQLLAEHRLIQEAVRRIHLLNRQCDDTVSDLKQASPCSVRSISSDSVDSSSFSSTSDL
ncbi:uncharacterized protein LOC143286036 [Babylonia areolata]|uniref:uncharacterized protein LOC143286036 n=1 Tax=Babylonia areolata TaxID=304850 RepID=UPI003FD2A9CD